MSEAQPRYDVILAGAGLANSLIALRLRERRPELRMLVLDAEVARAVEHTWSLFESDLRSDWARRLYARFDHRWDGYSVSFPRHSRELATGYASLSSGRLRGWLAEAMGADLRAVRIDSVTPTKVCGAHGEAFEAPLVLDGRGWRPTQFVHCAAQKFVGLEVKLRRAHGLTRPIVMDASVAQTDGYRFLYVLPTGPDTLLLEDTRYSDGGELCAQDLEAAILRYARGRGWSVTEIVRRETGVLPVVLGGDPWRYWDEQAGSAPQVGMAGLFFHPTTGYSLPDALAVAELLAEAPELTSTRIAPLLEETSKRLWRERSFYRLLNRMLFRAAEPDHRYRVLERFYRMPEPIVERFYAARTTAADKLRILSGRPPVRIWAALRAATDRGAAHVPA